MVAPKHARRTLAAAIADHDNGFNLVRLVCALLVLLFHAWQLNTLRPGPDPLTAVTAPAADLGSLAVGVFFVVSGIFVTQSWLRDPHILRFALRRVARIVPGLFVCLVLTTVVAVGLFSTQGWGGLLEQAPWRYILSNTVLHWLKYLIPPEEQSVVGVLHGQQLNGPLWTLYWEGRMYVMVALIGLSAALPQRRWFRGCALFLLLAAHLFPQVAGGYIWEERLWSLFLLGMLVQTTSGQLRVGPLQVLGALVLASLNWTRFAALTPAALSGFGVTLLGITAALWIGSARGSVIKHVQRHDYSFGVYIYHWPVILMLREYLPPVGPGYLTVAALIITMPLAILSWHVIESPAQQLVRRCLRARHPVR